jgi:hypothetical protein
MEMYNAEAVLGLTQPVRGRHAGAALQAELRPLFTAVRRAAQWRRLRAWIRGNDTLLCRSEALLVAARPVVLSHTGVQAIPINQIVGSEGRSNAFDRWFAPLGEHTRERWQGVAAAWLNGTPLPPVRLLQIDDRYIVRDGHHRISAAAIFGAATIEALVERVFVCGDERQTVTRPMGES